MRADKVWLIGHSNLSVDKARPFLEKIKKILEKSNIDVETKTADRYRLFDIVRVTKEIILEEKPHDIYLNVASGSKIHAVGLMMATMIFDNRDNLHPFYAQAKDYLHTKITEPQTSGIEEIHDLPTYQIQTPPHKQLEILKILVDNDGTKSIELGAIGVPETYLYETSSFKILKKYIGPLDEKKTKDILKLTKK